MAYNLKLPEALTKARWKVKIRDKEKGEHPHVAIIRGTVAWRMALRDGDFMDDDPDPAEVSKELIDLIKQAANWRQLCDAWDAWDAMYPNNPVSG